MQFTEINIAGSGTFQNTSGSFLLLTSWGNSFTINDPNGNAASGSIAAFVATNSIVVIPPSWKMVAGASAVFAQGIYLTPYEFALAVTGAPSAATT